MSFARPSPGDDPLELFRSWYDDALGPEGPEREMMALATATPDGAPSVRMVLFRGLADGRVRFYTHYDSRKGRELDANPRAALLFHWRSVKRQVRLEGRVEPLPPHVSDAYFASRPRPSQLSAAVSPQSEPIGRHDELLAARAALERDLDERPVPRPAAWGGFGLLPDSVELWEDDPTRLHRRWRCRRSSSGWTWTALAP